MSFLARHYLLFEFLVYFVMITVFVSHPDCISAMEYAPEWVLGLLVTSFSMMGLCFSIMRKCIQIDDKLDKLIKGDGKE